MIIVMAEEVPAAKVEVGKFNGKNNSKLLQANVKDLLIRQGLHNAFYGNAKKQAT